MKVDFRAGKAVVIPGAGRTFDPTEIREVIEKAGFSAPKVQVVARGKVEKWQGRLALMVPGQSRLFVLAGGEQFGDLQKAVSVGKQFRITGGLHGSHGDSPPGLTVEKVERFRDDTR